MFFYSLQRSNQSTMNSRTPSLKSYEPDGDEADSDDSDIDLDT